jgi:hypothetical protein
MVATQSHNNMVATQHGSSTKHGTNIIGHKGQEGKDNNTSRRSTTTVQSLQRTEKMTQGCDAGMCVLWGPLTECDWQNGCCMWRMTAAVDISDREEGGLRGFYKYASTSGSCDGYTKMTSLQRGIECSDVSYKKHWWQIWWPNGKEHLAAREHPYLSI